MEKILISTNSQSRKIHPDSNQDSTPLLMATFVLHLFAQNAAPCTPLRLEPAPTAPLSSGPPGVAANTGPRGRVLRRAQSDAKNRYPTFDTGCKLAFPTSLQCWPKIVAVKKKKKKTQEDQFLLTLLTSSGWPQKSPPSQTV